MNRLIYLLNTIKEWFNGKCRFVSLCEFYTINSNICNKEACGYCGKYRQLIDTYEKK